MSDMKCPFCGQELEETMFARGRVFVSCNNPKCPIMDWGGCSKQIITELIRTRKALGVAMDGLKRIEKLTEPSYKNRNLEALALAVNTFSGEIIKQITALEQKD